MCNIYGLISADMGKKVRLISRLFYLFFLNEGLAVKNLIWVETGFGQHGSMRCLRAGVLVN